MALTPNQVAALIVEVGTWPVKLLVPLTPEGKRRFYAEGLDKQAIRWLDIAIAVCTAESGRRPKADNPNSSAAGLWQVMQSVHKDKIKQETQEWAERFRRAHVPGIGPRDANIYDPYVNTAVAGRIYQEAGGWTPWEVFNNGSYRRHLGNGERAFKYLNGPVFQARLKERLEGDLIDGEFYTGLLQNAIPGAALGALSPGNIASSVMNFAKDAGVAIGVFILGLVLAALGIWFILSRTDVGRTTKRVAKKVVTKK